MVAADLSGPSDVVEAGGAGLDPSRRCSIASPRSRRRIPASLPTATWLDLPCPWWWSRSPAEAAELRSRWTPTRIAGQQHARPYQRHLRGGPVRGPRAGCLGAGPPAAGYPHRARRLRRGRRSRCSSRSLLTAVALVGAGDSLPGIVGQLVTWLGYGLGASDGRAAGAAITSWTGESAVSRGRSGPGRCRRRWRTGPPTPRVHRPC